MHATEEVFTVLVPFIIFYVMAFLFFFFPGMLRLCLAQFGLLAHFNFLFFPREFGKTLFLDVKFVLEGGKRKKKRKAQILIKSEGGSNEVAAKLCLELLGQVCSVKYRDSQPIAELSLQGLMSQP